MAETFGERVLLTRRRQGHTQRQLAAAARVSTNTIARLEQGVIKNLSGDIVGRLAIVLGTTSDYLLGLSADSGVLPVKEPV